MKSGNSPKTAGAIYDFMGYLTQHPDISVGEKSNATFILDRFIEWAAKRGLDTEKADVKYWQFGESMVEAVLEGGKAKTLHLLKPLLAKVGIDLEMKSLKPGVIRGEFEIAGVSGKKAKEVLVSIKDSDKVDSVYISNTGKLTVKVS